MALTTGDATVLVLRHPQRHVGEVVSLTELVKAAGLPNDHRSRASVSHAVCVLRREYSVTIPGRGRYLFEGSRSAPAPAAADTRLYELVGTVSDGSVLRDDEGVLYIARRLVVDNQGT